MDSLGGEKMKDIIIKCTKMILVMTEAELLNSLSPDLFEKAIKRGKGYKRSQRVEQWEKSRPHD